MALINSPGLNPVDRLDGGQLVEVNQGWRNFFNQIFILLTALTMSGATADRPTKVLWVGRPFFDTTLGYVIHVQTLAPAVWVRWDGTPV